MINKMNEICLHLVSKGDNSTQITMRCNVNAPIEELAHIAYARVVGTDDVEIVYDGNGYKGVPVTEEPMVDVTKESVTVLNQVKEPTPHYSYEGMNVYQMPMYPNGYIYGPPLGVGFIPINYSEQLLTTPPGVYANISDSIKGKMKHFTEKESYTEAVKEVSRVITPPQNIDEQITSEDMNEDDSSVTEETVRMFLRMLKQGKIEVVGNEDFVYGKYHGYEDDLCFYLDMDFAYAHFSDTVKIVDPKKVLVDPIKIEQYLFQRGYVDPENEATRRYRKRVTVVTTEGMSLRKRFLWIKKTAFEFLENESVED